MKTVALVGMAQSTRDLTPWDDENIEIWTLNESPSKRFSYVKRVTRHFQLHPLWNCMREGNQNDPEHGQWLRTKKEFPIYMQEVFEEVPASVKYPFEEIHEKFGLKLEGEDHWREFTNTFPYMLALAMYEEFDRIEIYGFEMGSETEYAYQRPSVHLWLGIARGLWLTTGKPEIYIPDKCELLGWGTPLYGYQQILNLNPMEIEIDRNKFANQAQQLETVMNVLQGRQNEVNDIMKGIRMKYEGQRRKIQEKKQDKALTERRLQNLAEQEKRELSTFQARAKSLEEEKLDKYGLLNYHLGSRDHAQAQVDRHNNQRPKKVQRPQLRL
jgi:hypothetical protein